MIGFSGPSSSMHCLTRLTEELLPSRDNVVDRLPPVEGDAEKPEPTPSPRPSKPARLPAKKPPTPARRRCGDSREQKSGQL